MAPTPLTAALPVCPSTNSGVTAAAARQARYREKHKEEINAQRRAQRLKRKFAWQAARRKHKTMDFDGRESGPMNDVGPLRLFKNGEKL